MKSSQSSSSSSVRSNSSGIKSIIETQAKVATLVEDQAKIASMMENILANQERTGTSDSPPLETPDNIEDKATAASGHSIDEVSFAAAGTVNASISVISNNTNVNHYIQSSSVPPLQSCLRQCSQQSDKHVSFHDSTSFQQPITSSTSFMPYNTVWPFMRSDIDTIDSNADTNNHIEDEHEVSDSPDYTDDEFIYARSTQLPSSLTPSSTRPSLQNDGSFWTVTDSGATHNMNSHRHMFDTIYPLHDKFGRSAQVILGDGVTKQPVKGWWGYAKYSLNGIPVRKKELFVPNIGTHLTSVTQHCQYQGCYFHAENGKALLAFPDNVLQVDCTDELTLQLNTIDSSRPVIFDQETAPLYYDSPDTTTTVHLANQAMCNLVTDPRTADLPTDKVLFQPLTDNTIIPTKGTPGSAGYDVFCPIPTHLPPHSITNKIPLLNFSLAFDPEVHAQLKDRSSMALRNITVQGGTIDSDYRGNIILCLKNDTPITQTLPGGSRVAQIIFYKHGNPVIQVTDKLPPTTRGKGGFGSTNKHSAHRIDDNRVLFITQTGTTPSKARIAQIPTPPRDPSDSPTPALAEPTIVTQTASGIIVEDITCEEIPTVKEVYPDAIDMYPHTPLASPTTQGDTDSTITFTSITKLHDNHQLLAQDIPSESIFNNELPQESNNTIFTTPPVNTVNSALPGVVTLSRDNIRRATGFTKSDSLIKHIRRLGNKSIHIQNLPRDPTIDQAR